MSCGVAPYRVTTLSSPGGITAFKFFLTKKAVTPRRCDSLFLLCGVAPYRGDNAFEGLPPVSRIYSGTYRIPVDQIQLGFQILILL